eukprot:COSAG02_NODE_12254_length_1572_cov_126.513238_1_plen_68_part_00
MTRMMDIPVPRLPAWTDRSVTFTSLSGYIIHILVAAEAGVGAQAWLPGSGWSVFVVPLASCSLQRRA